MLNPLLLPPNLAVVPRRSKMNTGILIDPIKPEEIKSAIIKLASDSQLWEEMSTAGVLWARNFDWSNQMKKIKEITG